MCRIYNNGENRGKLQPQKVATKDGLISSSAGHNIAYKQRKKPQLCSGAVCYFKTLLRVVPVTGLSNFNTDAN